MLNDLASKDNEVVEDWRDVRMLAASRDEAQRPAVRPARQRVRRPALFVRRARACGEVVGAGVRHRDGGAGPDAVVAPLLYCEGPHLSYKGGRHNRRAQWLAIGRSIA